MTDELTDEELSRMKPARDVLKPELFEKLTDTDPYEKRAREIAPSSGNVFTDLDLPHHAKALDIVEWLNGEIGVMPNAVFRELVSSISSALREAAEGEREACAGIADGFGRGKWRVDELTKKRFDANDLQTYVNCTGRAVAEDIRSRCHASPEQADQSVSREDSALQSEPAPDAIPNAAVMIDYTNYRGERGLRRVIPDQIFFGSNEWHPEPQWLMLAYDCEKKAERIFSVRDIHSWRVPSLQSNSERDA